MSRFDKLEFSPPQKPVGDRPDANRDDYDADRWSRKALEMFPAHGDLLAGRAQARCPHHH